MDKIYLSDFEKESKRIAYQPVADSFKNHDALGK